MYYVKSKVVLECHSTITAVTDVTFFIYKNMDPGQLTGTMFLDLKRHLTL